MPKHIEDRPAPETDKLSAKLYNESPRGSLTDRGFKVAGELADHARRLERQRDAAVEALEDMVRHHATGSAVFAEIAAEVERATSKFPTWPTDALHAVGVVAEEMGELQKEVIQLTYEPHKSTQETVRKEAVQLAAMSIRFLMSLDRYAYEPCPQHSQQNDKLRRGEKDV